MALLKRKEHGLGTWVLFVDLVKAFDSVDRTVMLDLLGKYGVPAHLVRLISLLHTDVRVKLAVGETEVVFESTVGVKQGDNMAPVLFLFVMQAAMETLESVYGEHGVEPLRFCTAPDSVITGRSPHADGDTFVVRWTLYADDAGGGFQSRADLERGARLLKAHLARFGLEMHCGRADADGNVVAKSKTEAMFFPPPRTTPTDDDLAPLRVDDRCGVVTFTDRFRYLGSILTPSLTDDAEVSHRVAAASAQFATLMRSVFRVDFGNRALPLRSKGRLYYSLVLGVLLYGCESWVMSNVLRNKLSAFHNRCVRAMCGVSRRDVRDDHCGHNTLYARLNVPCVLRLISNRKLRWAGHVARMDMHRLPRKFLSSWVKDVPRPRGRAQSYGHDLSRELNGIGFNLLTGATMLGVSRDWLTVAQDRDAWRVLVEPLRHVEANPISSQSPLAVGSQNCSQRRCVDSIRVTSDVGGGSGSTRPPDATWAARLRPRR